MNPIASIAIVLLLFWVWSEVVEAPDCPDREEHEQDESESFYHDN